MSGNSTGGAETGLQPPPGAKPETLPSSHAPAAPVTLVPGPVDPAEAPECNQAAEIARGGQQEENLQGGPEAPPPTGALPSDQAKEAAALLFGIAQVAGGSEAEAVPILAAPPLGSGHLRLPPRAAPVPAIEPPSASISPSPSRPDLLTAGAGAGAGGTQLSLNPSSSPSASPTNGAGAPLVGAKKRKSGVVKAARDESAPQEPVVPRPLFHSVLESSTVTPCPRDRRPPGMTSIGVSFISKSGRWMAGRWVRTVMRYAQPTAYNSKVEAAIAHDKMLLRGGNVVPPISPQEAREMGLNYDLALHQDPEVIELLEGTDGDRAFSSYRNRNSSGGSGRPRPPSVPPLAVRTRSARKSGGQDAGPDLDFGLEEEEGEWEAQLEPRSKGRRFVGPPPLAPAQNAPPPPFGLGLGLGPFLGLASSPQLQAPFQLQTAAQEALHAVLGTPAPAPAPGPTPAALPPASASAKGAKGHKRGANSKPKAASASPQLQPSIPGVSPYIPKEKVSIGISYFNSCGRYKVQRHVAGKLVYPSPQFYPNKEEAAIQHDLFLIKGAKQEPPITAQEARNMGLNYDLGLHKSPEVAKLLEKTDPLMAFSAYGNRGSKQNAKLGKFGGSPREIPEQSPDNEEDLVHEAAAGLLQAQAQAQAAPSSSSPSAPLPPPIQMPPSLAALPPAAGVGVTGMTGVGVGVGRGSAPLMLPAAAMAPWMGLGIPNGMNFFAGPLVFVGSAPPPGNVNVNLPQNAVPHPFLWPFFNGGAAGQTPQQNQTPQPPTQPL